MFQTPHRRPVLGLLPVQHPLAVAVSGHANDLQGCTLFRLPDDLLNLDASASLLLAASGVTCCTHSGAWSNTGTAPPATGTSGSRTGGPSPSPDPSSSVPAAPYSMRLPGTSLLLSASTPPCGGTASSATPTWPTAPGISSTSSREHLRLLHGLLDRATGLPYHPLGGHPNRLFPDR